MTAANLLSGLVQGFADRQKEERDNLQKDELKKMQIKLFKHQLEQQEKTEAAKKSLIDALTQIDPALLEGTSLPADQAGPTRPMPQPGQGGLSNFLKTPQGQAAALNAGYKLDDIRQFQQPSQSELLEMVARMYSPGAQAGTTSATTPIVKFGKGGVGLEFDPFKTLNYELDKRKADYEMGVGGAPSVKQMSEIEAKRMEENRKKSEQATNMVELIQKADSLLNDASSGLVETGVSLGKRAVGKSDATTQANEQLKLISGWLVSNVPRMEGPQSEFDVRNYQQMAGQVGDSTVPVEDRRAALKSLLELQKKYGASGKSGGKPSLDLGKEKVIDFSALPKK